MAHAEHLAPEPPLELGGEASGGQPEVEGGVDEARHVVGVEHAPGHRDRRLLRRKRAGRERLGVVGADEVEDLGADGIGARPPVLVLARGHAAHPRSCLTASGGRLKAARGGWPVICPPSRDGPARHRLSHGGRPAQPGTRRGGVLCRGRPRGGGAVRAGRRAGHRLEFDESGYRLSAVHYANGFPTALLHDPTAYATGRLYPLLLVPLFALLDGTDGVQAAKVLNGLLWASTAIPLWLRARPLLTPWRRAAAVSLGVVTPWMALTTLMFTENIAIPAFVWFTYAALMAVRRPVWWRDLLALIALGAALGARAQLVSLGLGYLALIAWTMPVPAVVERSRAWRVRALARHLRRGFPCTSALLLLSGLAAVGLVLAGQGDRLSKLGRGYVAERTPWLIDLTPLVLLDTLVIACGGGRRCTAHRRALARAVSRHRRPRRRTLVVRRRRRLHERESHRVHGDRPGRLVGRAQRGALLGLPGRVPVDRRVRRRAAARDQDLRRRRDGRRARPYRRCAGAPADP